MLFYHVVVLEDSELNELRKTIEHLKKQNTATQAAINSDINLPEPSCNGDRSGEKLPPTSPWKHNKDGWLLASEKKGI